MAAAFSSCSICLIEYQKNDVIHAAFCGHVYHHNCLVRCQQRTFQCPICSQGTMPSQKIYINFEEPQSDKNEKITKLETEKIESQKQIEKLQKQLKEKEEKIQKDMLEMSKLQHKLDESALNFVTLHTHPHDDNANNDIDAKNKNLSLQAEIRVMKQKLQEITMQLQKEIRNNIELSVDKTRLTSMLQNMDLHANLQKHSRPHNTPDNGALKLRSIVIRGTQNKSRSIDSLKRIVYDLCRVMNINLAHTDIEKVYILDKNNIDYIAEKPFAVQFKTIDMKKKVLEKIDLLKSDPNTERVDITEHVGVSTDILYNYAKQKLKTEHNYYRVYCKDNKVYAQKDNDSEAVPIQNKFIVDILCLKFKSRDGF